MTAERKTKLKRIAGFLLFLLIFFILWRAVSNRLKFKESYFFQNPFYENKKDYDVLFFGSSHPHVGIDPYLLWDEYGITSYNLGSSGEQLGMIYYSVKSALDNSSPKLIVVDPGSGAKTKLGDAHKALDAMPYGPTKSEAIAYLIKHEITDEPLDFLSSLWTYHGRIFSLDKYDFTITESADRGGDIGVRIYNNVKVPLPAEVEADIGNKEGSFEMYKKIVALCKERGVELLMCTVPTAGGAYTEEKQAVYKVFADYTRSQGFNAIDMNTLNDEVGLDYDYDYSNGTHLNKMGAWKTSEFLAKYLINNYGLEDHRNDENYSRWDEDRYALTKEIEYYLEEENEIVRTIMRSKDKNLKSEVYLKDDSYLESVYGLEKVIEFSGATLSTDGSNVPDDKEAFVRVIDTVTGETVIENYYSYNKDDETLTVDGEAAKSVNFFPEVDDD